MQYMVIFYEVNGLKCEKLALVCKKVRAEAFQRRYAAIMLLCRS
jgi:hypothetical protein